MCARVCTRVYVYVFFKGSRACVHICKHPKSSPSPLHPVSKWQLYFQKHSLSTFHLHCSCPTQLQHLSLDHLSLDAVPASPPVLLLSLLPHLQSVFYVVAKWSSANVMGLLNSSSGSRCIEHRTGMPCVAWELPHGLLFLLWPLRWLSHVLTLPATRVFSAVL